MGLIKINLAPPEELDDPRWWIPDVILVGMVMGIAISGVYYFLGFTTEEIENLKVQTEQYQAQELALKGDLKRHRELADSLKALKSKQASLSRITESRLVRYSPLILVEHVQNLKPEGLWLETLSFLALETSATPTPTPSTEATNEEPKPPHPSPSPSPQDNITDMDENIAGNSEIHLEGYALDNNRVADFITALKSTANVSFDEQNLRTQVYFGDVELKYSQAHEWSATPDQEQAKTPVNNAQATAKAEDKKIPIVKFQLALRYLERKMPRVLAPLKTLSKGP